MKIYKGVIVIILVIILSGINLSYAKEAEIVIEKNPPVILDSGGPDSFGYIWIDSDEIGGPIYSWIDITTHPEAVSLPTSDDGNYGPIYLGGTFTSYGNDFDWFTLGYNGAIELGNDYYINSSNTYIPNGSVPNNLMAIFWDDIDSSDPDAEIWYLTDEHQTVLSFINCPRWNTGFYYTFQLILDHDENTILKQYAVMEGDRLDEATIGIENGIGNVGLQVCYNQEYMHDELAIFYDALPQLDFDAGPIAFVSPVGNGQIGQPFTPMATFENFGAQTVTFSVRLVISYDGNELYNQTSFVTNLAYDEEIDVTFPDYTPNEEGYYLLTAIAELFLDENPENDTLDYSFLVYSEFLPPSNLRATSNQDQVVPLDWFEPNVIACTTIAYDDGVVDNAYNFYSSVNISASKFSAIAPIEICSVFVHVLTEGDPGWPFPDGSHDPLEISVWEGNGEGFPGALLASEIVTCELGEWITVAFDPPPVSDDDDFWVGFSNVNSSGPYDAICLDAETDYPDNQWQRFNGSWSLFSTFDGDHFIRASVRSIGRNILLTENNPFMQDLPIITDTEELLGYNLYRDTSPDVPVDDGHRINTGYITEIFYDDEDVDNGSTYYYVATAIYDDDGDIIESLPSNEISGTPNAPGELEADPTSFTMHASPGQIIYENLTLINNGGLPVTFNIQTNTGILIAENNISSNGNTEQLEFTSFSTDYDKSSSSPEEEYPPVILDSGGPDEFGYIWVDSDEPDGPEYDWIDITYIGQPVSMVDDDNQGHFQMAFDFPFYGELFSTLRICSNGFISFTSTANPYLNESIPGQSSPENLLALFWDDLNPEDGGMIYYYSDDDMTVVSYNSIPHYGSSGPYTFQVILYPSGRIKYQYQNMNPPTNSATIGIQNANGDIGLQVAYNAEYVHNNLAVVFRIDSWLSVSPEDGVVEPGESFDIDVICDASDLEADIYEGIITIQANDENHQLDDITIPVTLDLFTGIENSDNILPVSFDLNQNYPNPFNAVTQISFSLPEPANIELSVFNLLGQKAAVLADGYTQAGYHSIYWNASDIASGIYFYRLSSDKYNAVKRMVLLK